MNILYFSPMIVGLLFIAWIYCKCYIHWESKLKSKEIDKAEFDSHVDSLAGGTLVLACIWVLITAFIAVVCIFADRP